MRCFFPNRATSKNPWKCSPLEKTKANTKAVKLGGSTHDNQRQLKTPGGGSRSSLRRYGFLRERYSANSKSPGFHVLSNQGSSGAYRRSSEFHPFPGMVCTQLASCPTGALGANHTVTEPSGFFSMSFLLLSRPANF